MIQFYINSRPVPRAIARHHLWLANPSTKQAEIEMQIKAMIYGKLPARKWCEAYGVSFSKLEG